MKKLFIIMFVLAAAAFVLSGCSKKNCEEICECGDDIYGGYYDFDEDECVEDCREDYKDDADCRKAVKELAKCIDDKGCEDAFAEGDCEDELEDMDDCDFFD